VQVAAVLGGTGQAFPHFPQFPTSLVRLIAQPETVLAEPQVE
jgi:hypothetical protein